MRLAPWKWALGLALTALILSLFVLTFNDSDFAGSLKTLAGHPLLLLLFVVLYTLAFFLRSAAWRHLMLQGNLFVLFRILQASLLANHLVPVKVGEALRPYLASKRGIPLPQALSTAVVARLLDFGVLLLISAILLPRTTVEFAESWGALAGPLLFLLSVGGLILWFRSGKGLGKLPRPAVRWVESVRLSLARVSTAQVLKAAAWTLPSWLLESSALLAVGWALGMEISVEAAIGVTAFTLLFQAFQFTPGGLGVYEASMTGALMLYGIPAGQALEAAVITHGLKFAYSYTFGLAFALPELRNSLKLPGLGSLRGSADKVKAASRLEVGAARLWNVVNEGKPFTPVFVLAVIVALNIPNLTDGRYLLQAGLSLLPLAPLFVIFYRFDFPLKLRSALWVYLGVFSIGFWFVDLLAIAVTLGMYNFFTVFLWGTVYYHLRIGTSWTNFTRFWRLVLENPDPTSGNFLEQVPKTLLLISIFHFLVGNLSWQSVTAIEAFTLGVALTALLLHQWFFTWAPPISMTPTRLKNGKRICRKFILIVIDGCRADRLKEANTPYIDRLRKEGTEFENMQTVYPARTVTAFSSMLTGAAPRFHGMRSNFVPSLGVKCDSIFKTLERWGMRGRLVGIAHLVDAFGKDVRTVTAVTSNDEIDQALSSRAKQVLKEEDPDLLVLQLLSVDQTGHARGSYHREYLEKIEAADRVIEEFMGWCKAEDFLDDATVMVTADHGQGIGIGGHGHLTKTELYVPEILWGKGVERGTVRRDPRSIMDIAPTISYFLGVPPPAQSTGQVLTDSGLLEGQQKAPVVAIVPAFNEAENLGLTLSKIPRDKIPNLHVLVVDDGSTDGTSEVAQRAGADTVMRHERNRGLGAALRTGLAKARELNAHAAVYIDADGEYDPREMPKLLVPILRGETDYVLGSRYRGSRDGQPIQRLLGNVAFTAMLCLLSGRLITDGQTGFRAFSRRALNAAEIVHDYNYAQVLTLDLLRKGMKLKEVPITYTYRRQGRSFISLQYLWRVPLGIVRELLNA